MEFLPLDEIHARVCDIEKALNALLSVKALVGKRSAKQWRFFRACFLRVLSPEGGTDFEQTNPVQAAQFKFEVEDKLRKYYNRPGDSVDYVFTLVHTSKLSLYRMNDHEKYPSLAGYSLLVRDQSIDRVAIPTDISLYLERIIAEANDAEFRAYAALPDINTEELHRWFCTGSPAIKEIINVLSRHQKKRWIISNPLNPSTKRLLNVKIKEIKRDIALVSTVEYWYLRWWDEREDSYVYSYRETNRQTYVLKKDHKDWKVFQNIRPLPRTSTPHRRNRRQNG